MVRVRDVVKVGDAVGETLGLTDGTVLGVMVGTLTTLGTAIVTIGFKLDTV